MTLLAPKQRSVRAAGVARNHSLTADTTHSRLHLDTCRIPDDCIDPRRYPLLAAREAMRQLVDDLLGRSILVPGVL